jgi:DNA-binding NtrC family response regulator
MIGKLTMQVLIVDDQPAVIEALQLLFELQGFSTLAASDPSRVLELIQTEDVGVVIQDMNFSQSETSGREGIELFRAIRKLDPDMPVLLMTAWTSLETAVQLVKEGAADYVSKPWNDDKLVATVKNLVRLHELSHENTRLRARRTRARRELAERHDLCGLVYGSDAMHELVTLAVKVARSDAAILITGPNGSGKELLAEIVVKASRRADGPFVKVNAGGLPDQLLDAELFGAEAGAFTGATKARVGRFEAAHGGTLFLDELGNLSPSGQMKLLRVLQTGELQRLGSNTTRTVDVRVVSATNADLPKMIADGTFREDLYFRLNVIELHLPPLAERSEDIPLLAEHFLAKLAEGGEPATLRDEAAAALSSYDWPGNVRELQNRLQRASLVCKDGAITPADLGLNGDSRRPPAAPAPATRATAPSSASSADGAERAAIESAIVRAGGVVAKAAAELGLSRQALYRRMERLGIELERRPKG